MLRQETKRPRGSSTRRPALALPKWATSEHHRQVECILQREPWRDPQEVFMQVVARGKISS